MKKIFLHMAFLAALAIAMPLALAGAKCDDKVVAELLKATEALKKQGRQGNIRVDWIQSDFFITMSKRVIFTCTFLLLLGVVGCAAAPHHQSR